MNKWMFVVAVLLGGCATKAQYQENIQSWVGLDADKLVAAWGYPDNQIKSTSGNPVYVYQYKEQIPYGNGYFITKECTTHFELDETNVVTRAAGRGNSCVSK